MRVEVEEILKLQARWSHANTPEMQRRGQLVRRDCAAWLKIRLGALNRLMPAGMGDLAVQGRDGTGQKTELPWVRVHSSSRSPSATQGWYVVFLFSALGDRVYLSLNQGTTRWENGEFRPREPSELTARVLWARQHLADHTGLRGDLVSDIHLDARSTKLGTGYEYGNVASFVYAVDAIPSDDQIGEDLAFLVSALGVLETQIDASLNVPGEPPPEVIDAVAANDELAGRRRVGRRFRLSAEERSAIEARAVAVAMDHLTHQGYTVKDVGHTHSFDIDARRDGERVFVEVKGTTSDGSQIVLTKNEVDLHRAEYPRTMLIIVSGIALTNDDTGLRAEEGTLRVTHPWLLDEKALTPLSFTYSLEDSTS